MIDEPLTVFAGLLCDGDGCAGLAFGYILIYLFIGALAISFLGVLVFVTNQLIQAFKSGDKNTRQSALKRLAIFVAAALLVYIFVRVIIFGAPLI